MKKFPMMSLPVAGIFALLALTGVFIFRAPEINGIYSRISSDTGSGEGLKIKNVKYSQDSRDGRGKWKLEAREARVVEKNNTVTFKDVVLRLDSSKKNESFTIKGKEGAYFRKKGRIILKGNVRGQSDNGFSLKTSLLIYSQRDDTIKTDKVITISGPFFQIDGAGACIDLKRNKFMIKKDVQTRIDQRNII